MVALQLLDHPVLTDGDFAGTFTVWSAGTDADTQPRTGITGMETLLQRMLPGMPVPASRPRPDPACRYWTTIVCFSCGKLGHGVGRCPELDETFPYMLPGWLAEKVGANYMMISPRSCRTPPGGKRQLIREGGVNHPDQ